MIQDIIGDIENWFDYHPSAEVLATIIFLSLLYFCILSGALALFAKEPVPVASPIIYLKSGGQFANYCQIGNSSDYDRVLNKKNIAIMRKIDNNRLEIDGRVVILFKNNAEREGFINVLQE